MGEDEVKRLIQNIKVHLDDGWSIGVARKRVLGSEIKKEHKELMATNEYQELLNSYVSKYSPNFQYERKDGKLGAKLLNLNKYLRKK